MSWIDYWLSWASSRAIKEECIGRGMHPIPSVCKPAIIYGEVTWQELNTLLPTKYIYEGREYYTIGLIRDEKYKLTSLSEIKRFLAWNLTDKDKYINEYYDCDNFSVSLYADIIKWTPGLCFGLMDIPGHAANIFMTADKHIYTIEPQTDVVSELPDVVTLYFI